MKLVKGFHQLWIVSADCRSYILNTDIQRYLVAWDEDLWN